MRALSALRHVGGGLFSALAELGNARMTPPRDSARGRPPARRRARSARARARPRGHRSRRGSARAGADRREPCQLSRSARDPAGVPGPADRARARSLAWPVIGPIGAALGVVFVRGDRVRVLRHVHTLLAAGVPVLDFPEGTSGDTVPAVSSRHVRHRATRRRARRSGRGALSRSGARVVRRDDVPAALPAHRRSGADRGRARVRCGDVAARRRGARRHGRACAQRDRASARSTHHELDRREPFPLAGELAYISRR